jgi:hypothetical protein
MKRAHANSVLRLFDLEAGVDDDSEDSEGGDEEGDDNDNDNDSDDTIDAQYSPQGHFANTVEASNRESDLVALLEECYASGSNTSHSVVEDDDSRNERPLEFDPTIAASIDNVTRLPTNNDYPLWRIRCKVSISHCLIPQHGS